MFVQIINPIEYPNWDELLLTNEQSTFFHTSAWARVLNETYKYKPLYFVKIENSKLSSLIPVMEIDSLLTGKRGVSLPFSDYCQPVSEDIESFREIIENQIRYGKEAYWKYIEWRGGQTYFEGRPSASSYLLHILDLAQDENEIISTFRNSTKRNIDKASRGGINVSIDYSLASIKAYYRLHCITRKHHGLPPQSWSFFAKIHEHIVSKEKGLVILGFYQSKPIAGAICFHLGTSAIFKYGACDRKYQQFRPNNLVMWKTIQWYERNGFKRFSLGRTELENAGLLQYKKGWRGKEKTLYYYKYDLLKNDFVKNNNDLHKIPKLLEKLPLPLLNFAGSILYRHMG